jgi:glutamate N-acetyltransferase/amino-acid N-acetyltransferase
VTAPQGFSAAAVAAGIRPEGLDLALVASERTATAAGVFTRNQFAAAPVVWTRARILYRGVRAVVINAGNANAGTGPQGLEHVEATARTAGRLLGCSADEVAVASTGVIGVPLPLERLLSGLERAAASLGRQGHQAARAIMTTDTFPKEVAVEMMTSEGPLRIGGMAKGAGMVHPDMATVLCLVTTDALLTRGELDSLLRRAVDRSFHRITVDGDTSTNDMVLVLASGYRYLRGEEYPRFDRALTWVLQRLAREVARDGEGATRLIEVRVEGAPGAGAARRAARAVAASPLVKAAIFGGDPNWGRVLAALGRSGVPLEPERVSVDFAGVRVLEEGTPVAVDEADLARRMQAPEVRITCHLGIGRSRGMAWGCDLSYDYIRINGSYRT